MGVRGASAVQRVMHHGVRGRREVRASKFRSEKNGWLGLAHADCSCVSRVDERQMVEKDE